ncbi:MAG: LacI family DNA-binding transcriptional regulator [Kordia sp.]|uniref:LacI family DNA-binding transcriptional regulator n=1 Tax=Kordia sp. TaxID=1965332 RepID=UPI00385DCC29
MIQTRTTLSEISKALNVSISTVSKSLSDSSEISLSTKKRIQDFANKCNYVPNNFAANLRKGYTNTIGLIIPNMLNPFYAKVFVGIEKYLDEHGYRLITSISNESKDKEVKSLKKMANGYVDGLIICTSKETEVSNEYSHINSLIGQGTPVVMFDRICELIDCDKVIINDYEASFETTEHLINTKNCSNILMASLIDDLYHGKLRTRGFNDAIERNIDKVRGTTIIANDISSLQKKLEAALKNDPTIDGILGVNEQAVLKAISTVKKLNINSLHGEVIIAGFCAQRLVESYEPLVIITQNAKKIGVESAKNILQRIKNTETKNFNTTTVEYDLY